MTTKPYSTRELYRRQLARYADGLARREESGTLTREDRIVLAITSRTVPSQIVETTGEEVVS